MSRFIFCTIRITTLIMYLLISVSETSGQNVEVGEAFFQVGENATIDCTFDKTPTQRVFALYWRASARNVNSFPSSGAILQYTIGGGIEVLDEKYLDRVSLTDSYSLVLHDVRQKEDIEDNGRYWCRVNVEGSIGENSRNVTQVDSGIAASPECTNGMCTCTATRFTPETNFKLRWKKDENLLDELQTPVPEPLLTDEGYFKASSSFSTGTKEYGSGNYTCCRSGDAYFFESEKEICNSYELKDCTNGNSCDKETETCENGQCKCRQGFDANDSNGVCEEYDTLAADMTMQGMPYTVDLADAKSTAHQDLKSKLKAGMYAVDGVKETYDFFFSIGSIRAEFMILLDLNSELTTNEIEQDIEAAFLNGSFGDLVLNKISVKEPDVDMKNEIPGGNVGLKVGLGVGIPILIIAGVTITGIIVWKSKSENKVRADEDKGT